MSIINTSPFLEVAKEEKERNEEGKKGVPSFVSFNKKEQSLLQFDHNEFEDDEAYKNKLEKVNPKAWKNIPLPLVEAVEVIKEEFGQLGHRIWKSNIQTAKNLRRLEFELRNFQGDTKKREEQIISTIKRSETRLVDLMQHDIAHS